MANDDTVRMSLALSPELNTRLEQLATENHTSKSEILRKAVALFDVASEAKRENKRLGILDRNKQLVTEIVGL